ncbi:peptidase M10A and M12B matrixin and adamalysin [bacterium]|nr:peptidase M10A and M12B matrixin and adamalysin [bacterium]
MVLRLATFAFFLTVQVSFAEVIVQIDYSYDSSGFFTNSAARHALETGIAHIASRLNDDLTAITPGPTPFGFSNHYNVAFTNPSTGTAVNIQDFAVPDKTLIVYVGARDLPGETLGIGGAGGWSLSGLPDFVESARLRGQGETQGAVAIDFAPWGGAITFDSLADWSFDTSLADPGSGFNSFISVVEHEFGHLLGYGGADSWKNKIDNVNGNLFFHGSASVAEFGGLVPLFNQSHWGDGIMSNVNGIVQEAVLDPTLTVGKRKEFSALDFAGLSDIGWEVLAVPEPSSIVLLIVPIAFSAFMARKSVINSRA